MTTGSEPDDDAVIGAAIERLDAGEPPSSPEEAQLRAPYERLLERVRDLEDIAPPVGWEDRAVNRWSRARRKRRLRVAGAATAVAALVALLLWPPCAASGPDGLEVAVLTTSGSTRRGDPAIGDVLQARVPLGPPQIELRVYLETALVARCPGSPGCRRDASALQIDWKTIEPGTYQIVVLSSASSIPAGDGTLDRDLLDARSAGANIDRRSLSVTP
jgi:hypothetical protein